MNFEFIKDIQEIPLLILTLGFVVVCCLAVWRGRSIRDIVWGVSNTNIEVLSEKIDRQEMTLNNIQLSALKLVIVSRLSDGDRIHSYHEYKSLGGNGSIDEIYERELESKDTALTSIHNLSSINKKR